MVQSSNTVNIDIAIGKFSGGSNFQQIGWKTCPDFQYLEESTSLPSKNTEELNAESKTGGNTTVL